MTRHSLLTPLLLLAACSSEPAPATAPPAALALAQMPAIDAAALLADTRKLASDEFGGRARPPGPDSASTERSALSRSSNR